MVIHATRNCLPPAESASITSIDSRKSRPFLSAFLMNSNNDERVHRNVDKRYDTTERHYDILTYMRM